MFTILVKRKRNSLKKIKIKFSKPYELHNTTLVNCSILYKKKLLIFDIFLTEDKVFVVQDSKFNSLTNGFCCLIVGRNQISIKK